MSDISISAAGMERLSKPISALKDEPDMNAADLKAYFDASPTELMQKHNQLIRALLSGTAAADIGFKATDSIPRGSVQDAIEYVREHTSGSGGTTAASNISRSQLDSQLINELDGYAALKDSITVINVKIADLSSRVRALEA